MYVRHAICAEKHNIKNLQRFGVSFLRIIIPTGTKMIIRAVSKIVRFIVLFFLIVYKSFFLLIIGGLFIDVILHHSVGERKVFLSL